MDIPASQIISVSLGTSDPDGVSIFSAPLGDFFPIIGDSFVILSTGLASSASLPNNEEGLSATLNGLNNSQGQDMVQMAYELQAPTGSTCLRFEFSFLSDEFPEFVGTSFNDVFTAEYPNSDITIVGNDIVAPLNFASDTEDNVINVNTVFGVFDNTGTTYDGSTPLLTATTPIDSTLPVRVVFTIQDMGDSFYDSAVFLDNFRWSFEQDCSQGSQLSTVRFTATSVDVAETGGTVTLTVTRIDGSDGELTVNYATTDGTATDGSDYVGATSTLTWANGDTSDKTLTLTITDDTLPENNETFTVTLSEPVTGESVDTATVTIIDNDDNGQAGSPQITSSTVNETAGTVTVTVSRVGGSNGELTVNYATTDGTATDGSDYVSASGTLTWADGDSSDKTFTVTISDDSQSEGNETFIVSLTDPVSGESLGSGTVTIIDNDSTLVTLASLTATGLENRVRLEWKTVTEFDSIGFHIWRATGEGWKYGDYSTVTRLTDQLIPAEGNSGAGASYSYIDYDVEPFVTYYYGLEDRNGVDQPTYYLDNIDSATVK
ncbi:hypothetical protein PN36_30880 [Candidatus Thiomargarita nelsonii]|uniref:Cadherin domain-containing protein n=1 Tax=Candidatus Thiomargarita nelsonii TaxID=1003181 RepID=A0A0A6P1V7_9GAMM|nr:hypothetical protein PN36_30880 [Candidatus Thiomargarita nelsonii]